MEDPELKATCHTTKVKRDETEADPDILKSDSPLLRLMRYYSDWTKLKRGIAWILAIKRRLLKKNKRMKFQLCAQDVDEAEMEIIRVLQMKYYSKEMHQIRSGSLPPSHPLQPLHPIVRDGMLCVGTRLKHSTMSHEFKCPRILPKKDEVVALMIRHTHETTGHSGREYVLAQMRQKYWITGGGEAIKAVLRNCVICRRCDSKPVAQVMADLPIDPVRPENPPFTNVGIDYFGPFYVKRGRCRDKRYCCLFTCMAIRAIHIEIAPSLDTTSFINCLQRFAARRGMPKSIRSDNGTNFVGGNRELKEALKEFKKSAVKKLCNQGISWTFNPPGASHMGGVWERQVRSVRRILAKMTKDTTFTDEGLSTLMCTIESIINNRPLTTVSTDPDDLGPLTPNHLLLLRSAESIPGKYDANDCYTRKRWRHIQYLADMFWSRWLKEYLPTLQSRTKWTKEERNLAVGDIVLIADSNVPRNTWNLGKIEKVHHSSDHKVRSAELRTKNGICTHPITKLYLLECQRINE